MRGHPIIGLTGLAWSGKDTAARFIEAYGYVRDSFAAPIREAVARILGWTLEELKQRKDAPVPWLDGITPRRMMQTLGTEWGREMHPELWTRSLFRRIEATRAVVSDVRFDNEAEGIIYRGGIVVQLMRKSAGIKESDHVTEAGISPVLIGYTLSNDGSFQDLSDQIRELIRELREY